MAHAIARAGGARGLAGSAALVAVALGLGAAAEPKAPAPGLEGGPCVACRASLDEARAACSEADWKAVLSGEVATREVPGATDGSGVGRAVSAAGIVAASPEELWEVLTDWASYPRFMPNIADTRIRRLEGGRAWLSQHLRVFFTDVRYGAIWELEPEIGQLRFALDPDVPHDIAAQEGSWRLTPLPNGGGTLVRYEARVDTGRAVPEFVQTALTRRSLPGLIRAVREEVARRAPAVR